MQKQLLEQAVQLGIVERTESQGPISLDAYRQSRGLSVDEEAVG